MKRLFNQVILFILVFAVFSCRPSEIDESLIPQVESNFAKEYLSQLRSHNYDYVKSLFSNELREGFTDDSLVELANYFRKGKLKNTRIIGSQVKTVNGTWIGNFTFEYEFEDGWNIANAALRRKGKTYEVVGLHVYQAKESLRETNAFTFNDKSLLHYFTLVLAIAIPIFIVFTVIICIKTPVPSKKWLWFLLILFGFGAFRLNWTTGQFTFQIFNVFIPGVSVASAGPDAPWIISISIPLGAIIFWYKRKKYVSLNKSDCNNGVIPDDCANKRFNEDT